MSTTPPPDLPGYDFQRELGHGGFADVYLYRQHLPSREVAVKVLRQPATAAADRALFDNEANRMAMLSSHPGIVTIYEVGVTPDHRPYLTMEYCPHDHFGQIARAQPLTVTRALEVGIKVAAAVETAHHASILHRDLKPANILLTTYGEPALTDFGIAGGDDSDAVSHGVSVPFAAPEVLSGASPGDTRSDVYSLGATVYALLAGRAPFSTAEGLTEAQLVQRVLHSTLPPTGRPDVPPSLERALATSLARDPAARYASAASFGRALQGVEAELGLAQTPLRIADTSSVPPRRTSAADDDSTRLTSLQRVDPSGPPPVAIAGVPPSTAERRTTSRVEHPRWEEEAREASEPDAALGDHTVARRSTGSDEPPPPPVESAAPKGDGSTARRAVLAAAALVVVLAVAFVLSKAGDEGDEVSPSTTTPDTSPLVEAGAPPRPVRVRIEPSSEGTSQVVTWEVPTQEEGDTYQVFFTESPDDRPAETTSELELTVDTGERLCLTVETIRGGRVSAASAEVCS